MIPDYYKLFGLDKNSTKDAVKKRYRELAKQFHPDINKSPDATSRMQEIQAAYYILNDDEARERYNQFYDYTYGEKKEKVKNSTSAEETKNYREPFVDPVLDKWIMNAQKQASDFIRSTYDDSKGIVKSGLKFLLYGLGINVILFFLIIILIWVFRIFA